MYFFQEWKFDQEMIEDGVLAMVAYVPSNLMALRSHTYMALFAAPVLGMWEAA
jgi:hypothetical protein